MSKSPIKISKFLSLVLRHKPESIGLSLDEHGWVRVDELLDAANKSGKKITLALLQEVVRENDKQRFSFSEDGSRIRANQGHSIQVDLELTQLTPPKVLYHGTVERFLSSIRTKGLLRQNRQYVHLSPDEETAKIVGKRRGEPVILIVDSSAMSAAGFAFFLSKNGVWLTERVPPDYLSFP